MNNTTQRESMMGSTEGHQAFKDGWTLLMKWKLKRTKKNVCE